MGSDHTAGAVARSSPSHPWAHPRHTLPSAGVPGLQVHLAAAGLKPRELRAHRNGRPLPNRRAHTCNETHAARPHRTESEHARARSSDRRTAATASMSARLSEVRPKSATQLNKHSMNKHSNNTTTHQYNNHSKCNSTRNLARFFRLAPNFQLMAGYLEEADRQHCNVGMITRNTSSQDRGGGEERERERESKKSERERCIYSYTQQQMQVQMQVRIHNASEGLAFRISSIRRSCLSKLAGPLPPSAPLSKAPRASALPGADSAAAARVAG